MLDEKIKEESEVDNPNCRIWKGNRKFAKELYSKLDSTGISNEEKKRIEKIMGVIIEKRKREEPLSKKIIACCFTGFVKGCIIGFVMHGAHITLSSGIMMGLVSPALLAAERMM